MKGGPRWDCLLDGSVFRREPVATFSRDIGADGSATSAAEAASLVCSLLPQVTRS